MSSKIAVLIWKKMHLLFSRYRLVDGARTIVRRANFGIAAVPASFFRFLRGGCRP